MTEGPDVGKMVKTLMEQKGVGVTWLAKRLGCHRNNVYLILNRSRIDTQTLSKLAFIFEYDFFSDFSQYYNEQIAMKKLNRT